MITELERYQINEYIDRLLKEYKSFMKIDTMPNFITIPIEVNLSIAAQKGYGVPASHSYDVNTGKHIVKVWKDIYKDTLRADYILFHEFTHIYDTYLYSKDKFAYAANKGFTEFHAAQIELLKLLGVESLGDKVSFSLTQKIELISGVETVLDYIIDSHKSVISLISKSNFPDSIETLSTVLGMVFNHLGRITICKMYCNDYEKHKIKIENMSVEKNFFGDKFSAIKSIMQGFLNETEIALISKLYFAIIIEQTEKMKGNL